MVSSSRGSPVTMVAELIARWCLVSVMLVPFCNYCGGVSVNPPKHNLNEPEIITINTEDFVKRLEYEAEGGVDNALDSFLVPVDLNLLPDDILADDIDEGLKEEFAGVDESLKENSTLPVTNSTVDPSRSRQLSLIYKGVYAPDSRFNAFVDGVMVNMVAEMKRKRMDPLYFRVYDRGVVEHVAARAGREGRRDEPPVVASSFTEETNRNGRQRGAAIGGGVIRGLTNVKRFGNAEVQIAGNVTLVRSHYVFGPLNIELIFHTENGVKTINSTLGAVAAHAVTEAGNNSSKLIDFIIDSPAEYEVRLLGARSRKYQRLSQSAIMRLFKPTGRMERRLRQTYVRATSRRIPDVVARNQRRNRNRNKNNETETVNNGNGRRNGQKNRENRNRNNEENKGVSPTPELP